MSDDGTTRRAAPTGPGPATIDGRMRTGRVKILAEAGAEGRALTPVEIQEICRALQGRLDSIPTHFHSGT